MGRLFPKGLRARFHGNPLSRPATTLLVGVIFTLASFGCTTAGPSVPPIGVAGKVTPLPVAGTDPTPTAAASVEPGATSAPTPPAMSPTANPAPTSTPKPDATELSLNMTILAPTQGAGLEVGAIRVLGVTSADAEVTINNLPTEVAPDGSFTRDLILGEGINSVEATAMDKSGQKASDSLVVLFVPRAEGVPLSILFPQGLEVSNPNLTIMGATRPDAVVGINGVPVDVNSLGIFSTSVVLEEGTNLVEVVAVDLDENVNFQTVVVFYIP